MKNHFEIVIIKFKQTVDLYFKRRFLIWIRNVLCKKDEISSGETKIFQIRRTSIVVVRKEDEFYALRNWCPHQGAELGKGVLRGAARSYEGKEISYEKPGGFVLSMASLEF